MKTKRAFLTICALPLFMGMYSQLVYDDNPHLMFNNVPMNGTLAEFTEKLVKQGFTIRASNQYIVALNAEMLGKPCVLSVSGTKKSKSVYQLNIMLPAGTNWQAIKEDYNKLKNLYAKHLGVGISKEYFSDPYTDGDGKEMDALNEDKLNYSTYWKSESGIIMVSIMSSKEVYVVYQDKTNIVIAKNEEL